MNTPNLRDCFWNNETSSHTFYAFMGPSSNHPGGVPVSMIEGSAGFIVSDSPAKWWALSARAVGEVISADSY